MHVLTLARTHIRQRCRTHVDERPGICHQLSTSPRQKYGEVDILLPKTVESAYSACLCNMGRKTKSASALNSMREEVSPDQMVDFIDERVQSGRSSWDNGARQLVALCYKVAP